MGKRITGYFRVVNEIFPLNIRPYDYTVLCYLLKCADKNHECYPSRDDIATNCNMSLSQVKRSIKTLKTTNYIINIATGHTGHNNHYILSNTLFKYPDKQGFPQNLTRSPQNPY